MSWLRAICYGDWAEDSTVFCQGSLVIKVYKDHILEQDLRDYHGIHNSFAWEDIIIKVNQELEFWNEAHHNRWYVSDILINVLQIADGAISNNHWVLVARVPYVGWYNAVELEAMYPNFFNPVGKYFKDRLGMDALSPHNIKVSNIVNERITLTITDLAVSIRLLVDSQK